MKIKNAPLFLLGMKEIFGDDGFDIVELPLGQKISVEQFSEFENAYQYFAETEKYTQEIQAAIAEKNDKPLIITEGATDWKHMKAAYDSLLNDPRCSEWLPNLKKMFCNERNSCGNEKIRIIDGHEKSPRVYSIADENKTTSNNPKFIITKTPTCKQ